LLGLLQPIVLDSKHKLLAGERRLRACQVLGWSEIEAKVMPACRNGDSRDEG
jgi:ParB-like chromosome segregation protein Spo0J